MLSRSAELSDVEIESLRHSLWEIDCPQITIKSRSLENPLIFSGAGFIKQTANYQLTFKAYTKSQTRSYISTSIDFVEVGTTIPDDSYYDFTALDYKGRLWVSEHILPDINECASGETIIQGDFSEVSCEGEIQKGIECSGGSLEFKVFDSIAIPYNERTIHTKSVTSETITSHFTSLNIWKFRCCDFDFLFVKEERNYLIINVASKTEDMPKYFKERILEALQFILGRPINWTTFYRRIGYTTKTILCSPRLNKSQPRFQPPLLLNQIFNEAEVYKYLFEKYFKHVINDEQLFHPLWAQLNAVYEASSGMFVDAHALTLAVAIESLLRIEYQHLGQLTQEEKQAVLEAKKYMDAWDGNERIKKRVQGSIDGLLQTRAADRMMALVQASAITKKQYRAWQNLRNASAHTYQTHTKEHKEFIGLLYEVNVLLYQLIFHAIGYKGPYTDFSTTGWLIKQYPEQKS